MRECFLYKSTSKKKIIFKKLIEHFFFDSDMDRDRDTDIVNGLMMILTMSHKYTAN
jgi:hypothetical protein